MFCFTAVVPHTADPFRLPGRACFEMTGFFLSKNRRDASEQSAATERGEAPPCNSPSACSKSGFFNARGSTVQTRTQAPSHLWPTLCSTVHPCPVLTIIRHGRACAVIIVVAALVQEWPKWCGVKYTYEMAMQSKVYTLPVLLSCGPSPNILVYTLKYSIDSLEVFNTAHRLIPTSEWNFYLTATVSFVILGTCFLAFFYAYVNGGGGGQAVS